MVTRVNVDRTVRNISVKSLCCTLETNIRIYVNYILILKKEQHQFGLKITNNREVSQLIPIQNDYKSREKKEQNKIPLGSESISGEYAHRIDKTIT